MLNLKRYLRSEKGFTMIEMMVVLIIIAVLIGGGIKFYSGYITQSRVTKAKAEISTMQAALDSYYAQNNEVYPSVSNLGDAGLDTTIISSSGTKYVYSISSDSKGYAINTSSTDPYGGKYVYGIGRNGTSNPPGTSATQQSAPTTP